MSFSIRLTDEERALAFKKALFEKIEDEFDVTVGQEAYDEYIANQAESRPISELWKECDI